MILKKKDSCKFLQLFAELARIVYSDISLDEPTSQRVISNDFGLILPVIRGQLIHFAAAQNEHIKYYNNDRIKQRLDGKSPAQHRTLKISNH